MNSISTRIAAGALVNSYSPRSQSVPNPGKLSVQDIPSEADADHRQVDPVQTDVSFSTYGSRGEHLAVVVTDKETGAIIREIPSKDMQKLHVHLEVIA